MFYKNLAKLQINGFDMSLADETGIISYNGIPLFFDEGALCLFRNFCGGVPTSDLLKFPCSFISAYGVLQNGEYHPHQEHYYVRLRRVNNSLMASLSYFDPDSSLGIEDDSERQEYMLEMQANVENDPNLILSNNENDPAQSEERITMDSFCIRPKIFDSFDIEWTTKGDTYEQILKEADDIIKSMEYLTNKRLDLIN